MSEANNLILQAVREATYGTTPGTPDMWQFRVLSETLRGTFTKSRNEQIRGNRLMDRMDVTAKDVDGGFEAYLDYRLLEKFADALYMSAYQELPTRAGAAQITDVDAATDTYTVTTGDAFAEGHLVYFSGYAEAGNNGLKEALATSSATAIVVGDGTADETPGAAARAEVVGLYGGAGEITVGAASGGEATLTSTGPELDTLGMKADMWIHLGHPTLTETGKRFATAANNTFVRVKSIADDGLSAVLDHLPASWAADTGTGKTIYIFTTKMATVGNTLLGTTIQKDNAGLTPRKFTQLIGLIPNQAEIAFRFRDRARFNVGQFFGLDHELLDTSLDAAPSAAVNDDAIVSGANIMRAGLSEDFSGGNYCPELIWRIDNGLRGIENIERQLTYVGGRPGDALFTCSGRIYFNSYDIVTKYREDTPVDAYTISRRGTRAMVLDNRSMVITTADINASGRNEDWFVDFEAEAYVSPTANAKQSVVCLFAHLPAA